MIRLERPAVPEVLRSTGARLGLWNRRRTRAATPLDKTSFPAGAQPIAQSQDDKLTIFSIDTPDMLTLLFKKNDRTVTLFENDRKPRSMAAAK